LQGLATGFYTLPVIIEEVKEITYTLKNVTKILTNIFRPIELLILRENSSFEVKFQFEVPIWLFFLKASCRMSIEEYNIKFQILRNTMVVSTFKSSCTTEELVGCAQNLFGKYLITCGIYSDKITLCTSLSFQYHTVLSKIILSKGKCRLINVGTEIDWTVFVQNGYHHFLFLILD